MLKILRPKDSKRQPVLGKVPTSYLPAALALPTTAAPFAAHTPGCGVVFQCSDGRLLEISAEALNTMQGFLQTEKSAPEAGGVLLGRRLENPEGLAVDQATVPQRGDRQARFSFFRKHRAHQRLIEQAWRNSGGTCNYLGEWHTHPEAEPMPSMIDLRSWAKQVRTARFEGDSLVFVILGTHAFRVFEVFRGEARVHILSPIFEQHGK